MKKHEGTNSSKRNYTILRNFWGADFSTVTRETAVNSGKATKDGFSGLKTKTD